MEQFAQLKQSPCRSQLEDDPVVVELLVVVELVVVELLVVVGTLVVALVVTLLVACKAPPCPTNDSSSSKFESNEIP